MIVGLATCRELPDLDPDDRLLRDALGGEATAAVWDDPAVDWEAFELVVVRSPWDYPARREEFLAWADMLGARVVNPPAVLRWNTDKRYLADLEAAGLPVVPTSFVAPGAPLPQPPLVVKPAVGAGSLDAARHEEHETAAGHVARLHADGRVALAQPYVDGDEVALIYLGGAFSHAIGKGPMLGDGAGVEPHASGLYVAEEIAAREPSAAERAVGDRVIAFVRERFGELPYARVDLLAGAVLELELTEPSLFLGHSPGAAERLAHAVLAWTA